MKRIEHENAVILVDEFSWNNKKEIRDFVTSEEVGKIAKIVKSRFYLVLGGDGTMLRAIQQTFKDNLPYLGINFGSKGFLLNEQGFAKNNGNTFKIMKYPMLSVEVDTGNGKLMHTAFNEVQVKTAGGHMTDLNLGIGKHSQIRLKGDGLIIATPAGSTGYNISAGGPILPHTSPNFIATPLLSFVPRNMKPIVFEQDDAVTITNNNERGYEFSVYADATPVIEKTNKDLVITIKKCKHVVKLLIAASYKDKWNAKIYGEQGFEFVD